VSGRRILALLVVLALSLGLCSIPAGSATLQRPSVTGESVTSFTTFKDGDDGEDLDGGDDDRWGNTEPPDDDPEVGDGGEGDDGMSGEARMLGRLGMLRLELEILFGFLMMVL
jgi:hypothetical protein